MPLLAPALALAASVAWGLSDFLGGLKSRRVPIATVLVWSQFTGLVYTAAIIAARREAPPEPGFLAPALISGVAGLIGVAALFRGLSTGSMSVVAPISGTLAPVLPVAIGVVAGERPSTNQALGALLALVGAALASFESRHANADGGRLAGGVGWAVIAALGFGGFFAGLHASTQLAGSPWWPALAQRATSVGVVVAAALLLRLPMRLQRRDLPIVCLIGALDVTANLMFAAASVEGLVSLTSILASLYPIVTVILASLILGERLARHQHVGIVGALAGVALITAA
jgi:drug/metabolite transporter (DMT)-like permease